MYDGSPWPPPLPSLPAPTEAVSSLRRDLGVVTDRVTELEYVVEELRAERGVVRGVSGVIPERPERETTRWESGVIQSVSRGG